MNAVMAVKRMDKTTTATKAVRAVRSGDVLMVGGFGVPGTPFTLIDALLAQRTDQLTLIKNEANIKGMGVSKLLEAGRIKKLIASHVGLNPVAVQMMNSKEIEVEFSAQGILAERIRAGGAGLMGIVTDIGVDTLISETKTHISLDGRRLVVETALRADVAFIHAATGDRIGNLVYEKSARNFNPAMATAAAVVIAEVENLVETGSLDPNHIHTPGAFIDQVVEIEKLSHEYGILEDYVLGP
jgi:acetate CoA/acetoacetate CoA-transferase alpha subunit